MRDYLRSQIVQTAPTAPQGIPASSVWDMPTTRTATTTVQSTSVCDEPADDPGEGPLGLGGEEEPEEEDDYVEEEEEEEDDDNDVVYPPSKRARRDPFKYMWREIDEQDAWVSQDSPGEAELFITQPDPSPPRAKRPQKVGRNRSLNLQSCPKARPHKSLRQQSQSQHRRVTLLVQTRRQHRRASLLLQNRRHQQSLSRRDRRQQEGLPEEETGLLLLKDRCRGICTSSSSSFLVEPVNATLTVKCLTLPESSTFCFYDITMSYHNLSAMVWCVCFFILVPWFSDSKSNSRQSST